MITPSFGTESSSLSFGNQGIAFNLESPDIYQYNLTYEREASAALEAVDNGSAQIAFLLNACDVEQVMRIATAGEVLPQKSTDFYPKLLSGITMYGVD